MRPSRVLARAAEYLERHGVQDARPSAEILLMDVLGTDRAGLYARADGLSSAEARLFGRALCRRCTGVPVQHLTGDQPFHGLRLAVRPGVFVPRPETELLVDEVLVALEGRTEPVFADVGTGSGAIALAVKAARPDAAVWATDLSSEAVALARDNALALGLDVRVAEGEGLGPLPETLAGHLDVVASNPPYVTEEEYADLPAEVRADPRPALVGGLGVFRELADEARRWLRPGGTLTVEIGAGQGEDVGAIMEAAFGDARVLPDLAGRDRIVTGVRP